MGRPKGSKNKKTLAKEALNNPGSQVSNKELVAEDSELSARLDGVESVSEAEEE